MEPPTSSDDEPVTCLGGCGRRLRSNTARARGYGERCWRKLHGRRTRRRHTPRPTTPTPAQPKLPDIDQLEIWSP